MTTAGCSGRFLWPPQPWEEGGWVWPTVLELLGPSWTLAGPFQPIFVVLRQCHSEAQATQIHGRQSSCLSLPSWDIGHTPLTCDVSMSPKSACFPPFPVQHCHSLWSPDFPPRLPPILSFSCLLPSGGGVTVFKFPCLPRYFPSIAPPPFSLPETPPFPART